jgi:hypothetical protein
MNENRPVTIRGIRRAQFGGGIENLEFQRAKG